MIFSKNRLFHLLFIICALTPSIATHSAERNNLTRSQPLDWGLYQIYWGIEPYSNLLKKEIHQLGGKPKHAMFFRDLIRPFPRKAIEFNDSLGLTTIVSLELTIWGKGDKTNYLERINNGEFDSKFQAWAIAAADWEKSLVYRFGFEMNANWFSWGNKPEAFKTAWKRIYQIFKTNHADNVQWRFSPNILWEHRTYENNLLPYYPGDEYVDSVGLDGYNFGDHHDQWHKWESYEKVFDFSINEIARFKKPIYLSEIGCADGERKQQWMKAFLEKVSADNRVHGFTYFNFDKRKENEPNWRIGSDAQSLDVFKNWAKEN